MLRSDEEIIQIKALALLTEWLKRESDDNLEGKVVNDIHEISASFLANAIFPHMSDLEKTVLDYEIKTPKDLKYCLGDVILKIMAVEMAQQLGVKGLNNE